MLSNEAIAQINSSLLSPEYIFLFFKNYNWKSLGSTSSIASAINTRIIKEIDILVPESSILIEFNKLISPLFAKVKNNLKENISLTQIKESLLSKLMTGKLQIS